MSAATVRPGPASSRSAGANGKRSQKGKRTLSSPESSESRSRMLLAALTAFRDGDFSCRLPSDWAGTEGRIAETFNQVIAHEDRISGEIERLRVTVGRDGRLSQRMSA